MNAVVMPAASETTQLARPQLGRDLVEQVAHVLRLDDDGEVSALRAASTLATTATP